MNKKIWAIAIVLILVCIGVVYASMRENTKLPEESITTTQKIEETPIIKKDFDAVITKSASVNIKDVSKSGANGSAWLGVFEGKTYHRVIAKNLPALPGTDFYEGWLVKNPLTKDYFSTGKLVYDPTTKEARLDFIVDGDKSDYRTIVITSELDDGNPKSGKHVLEGRFPADTIFQVTFDAEEGNTSK